MARRKSVSRRAFLAVMGSGTAAAILAACGAATTGTATPIATVSGATVVATLGPTTAATAAGTAVGTTAATAGATTAATGTTAATPAAAGTATSRITSPVTIRVWGFGLDDAFAQARVSVFQEANPNITLQPVGGTLNTQQLLTAVASGDPPEVVNVDRTDIASWAGRNAIQPIDDLVTRDAFSFAPYYPFAVEQSRYKDALYGIPQFVNLDLLFINLPVMQEAGVDPATVDPGNWEQMQQLGQQLAIVTGSTVTRTGFDTKMQDGRLWLWSWANGVDQLVSETGDSFSFTAPEVVEAVTWAKETVDLQGGDQARVAFQQTQNFFSDQNPVIIGQTVMTVFEQWLIGVLANDPTLDFFTMVPRMRNSQNDLTQASGLALAVPRGIAGTMRDAAWEFIKGLTSTDSWVAGATAAVEARRQEGVPYTPSITANQEADQTIWASVYKPIGPGFDATVALYPVALAAARFPYSGPVAAQVRDLVLSNVNDALAGATPIDQALADLQAGVEQALADFAAGPGNR
ncbi:MAG: extracellular solute-binding protein [Anaerolineae bacterium]